MTTTKRACRWHCACGFYSDDHETYSRHVRRCEKGKIKIEKES